MTAEEQERANELVVVVSDSLRYEAKKVGKDLDAMVAEDSELANVARSVTVDVVARTLMTSTDREPASQMSQSALGYSESMTFLVPGGGLYYAMDALIGGNYALFAERGLDTAAFAAAIAAGVSVVTSIVRMAMTGRMNRRERETEKEE